MEQNIWVELTEFRKGWECWFLHTVQQNRSIMNTNMHSYSPHLTLYLHSSHTQARSASVPLIFPSHRTLVYIGMAWHQLSVSNFMDILVHRKTVKDKIYAYLFNHKPQKGLLKLSCNLKRNTSSFVIQCVLYMITMLLHLSHIYKTSFIIIIN